MPQRTRSVSEAGSGTGVAGEGGEDMVAGRVFGNGGEDVASRRRKEGGGAVEGKVA